MATHVNRAIAADGQGTDDCWIKTAAANARAQWTPGVVAPPGNAVGHQPARAIKTASDKKVAVGMGGDGVDGCGIVGCIDRIHATPEPRPSGVARIPTGDVLRAHGARSSKVTADIDLAVRAGRNRVDLTENSGA